MPLNHSTRLIVEKLLHTQQKPMHLMNIAEYRASTKHVHLFSGKIEPVFKVKAWEIPRNGSSILVKQYTPDEKPFKSAIIYFRGGGFVEGHLEAEEPIYRRLANRTGCVVFAVSYRAAPEYKYPNGVNDAYKATKWILQEATALNIDTKKIVIAGYSSGANFAAVVALRLRNEGVLLAYQVLICPVLDLTCSQPSHQRSATGYILTEKLVQWYLNHYLPNEINRKDPDLSPLFANDFQHLPPTLIITAEYDPLCDDGNAYAEKLKCAGVPVIYSCYKGQIHQMWMYQGILDEKEKPLDEVVQILRVNGL